MLIQCIRRYVCLAVNMAEVNLDRCLEAAIEVARQAGKVSLDNRNSVCVQYLIWPESLFSSIIMSYPLHCTVMYEYCYHSIQIAFSFSCIISFVEIATVYLK